MRFALLNGYAWRTMKNVRDRDGAQTQEAGNGGTVQQRGQVRMENCSWCSKSYRWKSKQWGSKAYVRRSFLEVDSNLGAVVGANEGAVASIWGTEGRVAQAWVNVKGGLRFLGVHLAIRRLDSEEWGLARGSGETRKYHETPLVGSVWCKHVSKRFEKSLWFRKERMHVVALDEVSTCRSKGPQCDWFEKTEDYIIACFSTRKNPSWSLCGRLWVEAAKSSVFRCWKRIRDTAMGWAKRCQRCCVVSGERLLGRSTHEADRGEEEEKEESGERRTRNEIA